MPSNSYITFLHIRIDVLNLIKTHSDYTQGKRGRKNLGHLTRSAIVMLCAAWERYNEDLLLESIKYLCDNIQDASLIKEEIKRFVSSKIRNDRHELKPFFVAGDGWKQIWYEYAKEEIEALNTPKEGNLNLLFKNYLSIEKYSNLWKTSNPSEIDNFVKVRGDIAHNGNRADNVTMKDLRHFQDLIVENVIEIDGNIADELKTQSARRRLPWTKDYYTDLKNYK
ncbi:MAG: HEPN domain-containing protein [Chitinophagaceae bacterium]|nr:HEPN domain-containing protein [Chitinophagaceae bacterium]